MLARSWRWIVLAGGWTVGAMLSWSFFDGGATAAQVRYAEATRASLVAQAETLRQAVRLQIAEARASIDGAVASQAAAGEARAAADEPLRLAQAKYQTGAGTLLEVTDAQSKVAKAAVQVVQADWDLSAARANLAYAIGDR